MANNNQRETNGLRSYRRDVMKAVGAGTALGVLGGSAMADEHDNDEIEENDVDEDEENDEIAEVETSTVHVVRTLITESTNPERPADFFYQPTGLHVEPGDVVKFVFETPDHTVTSYHPAFGMQRRVPHGVQPFSSPILGWDPHSLPDDIDMPPLENGEHVENDIDENGIGNDEEDDENGLGNGEDNDENGVENDENGVENGVENGENDVENGEEVDEEHPRPSVWLYSFDTPGVYDIECAPHEAFGMAMRVVVGDETETEFETSDPDELPPPRAGPVGMSREVLTDSQLEPDNIVEEGYVEWMDLDVNEPLEPEDDEIGNGNGEPEDDENGNGNGEPEDDENGNDAPGA